MKKNILNLLFAAVFLLCVTGTQAQEGRVHYNFSYSAGLSNISRLEGRDWDDFYFINNGPASLARLDIHYNFSRNPSRNLELSSGFGVATFSATGMPDEDTRLEYSGAFYQVPLVFTMAGNRGNSFSTFVSIGAILSFDAEASLISQNISQNTVRRRELDMTSLGLIMKVGTRMGLTEGVYSTAAMEFQNNLSNQTLKQGAVMLNLGFGFYFGQE